MFDAEFVCSCEFTFKEHFLETEVSQVQDLEKFYIRCPRCGEEASPAPCNWPPKSNLAGGIGPEKRTLHWLSAD